MGYQMQVNFGQDKVEGWNAIKNEGIINHSTVTLF